MPKAKSNRKFDKVILIEILLMIIAVVLLIAAVKKTAAAPKKHGSGDSPFNFSGSFSRVSTEYKYGDLSLIPSEKVGFLNFGKNEDYFITKGRVKRVRSGDGYFLPEGDEVTAFAKSFGFEDMSDMCDEHGWLNFFKDGVALFEKSDYTSNQVFTAARDGKLVEFVVKSESDNAASPFEHAALIDDTLLIVTKYQIITVDLNTMDTPQLSEREFKDSATYAAIYCAPLDKNTVATLYRGITSSVLVTEAADGSTVAKAYIDGSALAMTIAPSSDTMTVYSAAVGEDTYNKDEFIRIDVFGINALDGSEPEFKESIFLPDSLACSVIKDRLFVEHSLDKTVAQIGDISVAAVLSSDDRELVTIAIDTSSNSIAAIQSLAFGERKLAGFLFD